ncbi:hypothetical protein ATCC90586_003768 [Pythium insidiosum]|nr:hypothetical protein ATCC90586_003768 [Pythium insidiosum]
MRAGATARSMTALALLALQAPESHAIVPQGIYSGPFDWVDPDTPAEFRKAQVPLGPHTFGFGENTTYELIFSDEFENSKRKFEAGFDRKWTAIDQLDTTNMGQHYFLPQAVQVDEGNLIITTTKPKKKYRGAEYVSGSLQSWNKFCYTGGFVEVRAILPGKWGIPGTWPALWIMGNIGRATFLGSQEGTWPWSYDYCGPWVEKGQNVIQKISACGNLTDEDDPDSYPEKYGMNRHQGRGATEIDIMEAQIKAKDQPAFISTSLQIRPSLQDDLRPASETLPQPGQWYQGLKFGNFSRINSDYYGERGLDAVSALTQLDPNAFDSYHLYQLDWSPGPDGYIRWWLDGNFLFEIPGSALNSQMSSRLDHQDRHNYDDFNEFFWNPACLKYDYKHEDVADGSMSPGPKRFGFASSTTLNGSNYFRPRKSVAEAVMTLHIPGILNCMLQVVPQLNNWLRRTEWAPVAIVRDVLNPMNRLYVGDNMLDPASASLGYQFFWATMIAWKLFFSYKFEISPLVIPSFLLYADHVENHVSIVTTAFLIFLNWFPFFFVFCQTAEELKMQRRQKWLSFSVAWDAIVDAMRSDDLISNKEKFLLRFQRVEGYQREIYLPMFQLAGSFESFTSSINDLYAMESEVSERHLQDKLLDVLAENPMIEEAIEEIWELATSLNLQKVGGCGRSLADLLSLLKSNLASWKNNAKFVPGMMYYEAAIRLLAQIEEVQQDLVEELIKTKFTYVVACQIYGRQKRNNDPKARDIEFLLHRFPNLRVAYIDEIRVNYQKEQSYFAVLIKAGEVQGSVEEVYRIRLPGNPILGEGKPENQNAAVIFTRETSFVTLGQRTLARPLRVRLHYGHPDVFNKIFFITRGGISKASKGINLSEDIFAGYNNCLRGGSVTFPEYIKCGKGRDVGMQQIYKFEAKLAQGAAEQSLSRDVYRISQRLDFFKLLSFYYNHVGFYLSMSLIIWTVYILLYFNLLRALLSLEGVGGREPVILSHLQVMLGSVAFFTTAPLFATISVERGFKAAVKEVLMIVVTGGPLYFLFHIGTKWFYFGQTILAGGAKYRATGRGFVTKHSQFDELYRFYASSHLYAGLEIATGLTLYGIFTIGQQYFAMTWSLWLVVASWVVVVYLGVSSMFFNTEYGETGLVRFMKLIVVALTSSVLFIAVLYVEGMMECFFSMCYLCAALGCWGLLLFGANSRVVQSIYFVNDAVLGVAYLFIILVLSALYVPGKIQTWLLYNNALSRGVVIEDILRANSRNDERDDELTLNQMRSIIIEQQRVISALTTSGSDSDFAGSNARVKGKDELQHTLSDNTLNSLRNVSESELAALHDASLRLQSIVQIEDRKPPAAPPVEYAPTAPRTRRAYSSSDHILDSGGLPPFASSSNGQTSGKKMN